MEEQEKLYLNGLNLLEEPPSQKVIRLYEREGSFKKVFGLLSKERNLFIDLEAEYRKLEKLEIKLVSASDKEYPALLKEAHHFPLSLYVLGSFESLINLCLPLAIVGTRKASREGEALAFDFGRELSLYGFEIISGLAYGIDQAAHKGALSQNGKTIAVLGSGLGIVLKDRLALEIVNKGGALISEYPLEAPGTPHHFPVRNRIIAGLSRGTLIIEAPERSGALITARFAFENNRDLFVIPGAPKDLRYRGSNRLIQEGAKLVLGVEDILEEYGLSLRQSEMPEIGREQKAFYQAIKTSPKTLEELCALSDEAPPAVLAALSDLELKGLIKKTGNKYTAS